MGKIIAVDGATFDFVNGSLPGVSGVITLLGTASVINKVNGDGFLLDGFQVQVTNITTSTATIPDPGPYMVSMNATIAKVKENSVLALVNGDISDLINATPQTPATPDPIDTPVAFNIGISDPNQDKVKAV